MIYLFDFDHVLCNTPSPDNRPAHTSETPKGVTEHDPPNMAMLELARALSHAGHICAVASYRKYHTFANVTHKWLNNVDEGANVFKAVYLNPCELPEKEGLSSPEVKFNHCINAMRHHPDQQLGMFFDDDPRVFDYLVSKGIPCSLVRAK